MNASATAPTPAQQNNLNRFLTLPGNGGSPTRRRMQNIFSQSFSNYVSGQSLTINVAPAPVGILTRFIIRVSASIGSGAAALTKTAIGGSAILSNISYIDPSNITRINTSGRHLSQLATHRRRRAFGAAEVTDLNSVIGLGANYTAGMFAAPSTIAAASAPPAATAPNFAMIYEVPIAYGPKNLQGAVMANYVNATQNLSLTINPNFFAAQGDTINSGSAGYISAGAALGLIGNVNINVYQEYLDGYNPATLPLVDLSTSYMLNETGGFLPTPNVDYPIAFQNFHRFMSAMLFYNNGGTFNAGNDINFLALRLANATDLIKTDPYVNTLGTREVMRTDPPPGYYWFDFSENPVFTNAYGNTALVVNASVVNPGASLTVGWESLFLGNVSTQGLP